MNKVGAAPRGEWIGLLPPEQARRLSGIEYLRGMLAGTWPSPPFTAATGIRLVSVEEGHAVFEAAPSERFYNPMAIVHGGWTALLLDSAMGAAIQSTLAAGRSCATIAMNVTFVRSLREGQGLVRGEGRVLHIGRRVIDAEARVVDGEGRLIAHGSETCMISDVGGPPAS